MNELMSKVKVFENIKGEKKASAAHYEVETAVRDTIEKVGGTLTEKLPTPNKSLKSLEKENSVK